MAAAHVLQEQQLLQQQEGQQRQHEELLKTLRATKARHTQPGASPTAGGHGGQ